METLKFRPTRILLVFRLIGVALVCLPFGGIVTAACVESNISASQAFSMGSLIPLVCLATYTVGGQAKSLVDGQVNFPT